MTDEKFKEAETLRNALGEMKFQVSRATALVDDATSMASLHINVASIFDKRPYSGIRLPTLRAIQKLIAADLEEQLAEIKDRYERL